MLRSDDAAITGGFGGRDVEAWPAMVMIMRLKLGRRRYERQMAK